MKNILFSLMMLFLISITVNAEKVIYELSSGNILITETDYAIIDEKGSINGSYNVYHPDWEIYGFGSVSNTFELSSLTNINDAGYFNKIYKLTDEEIQNNKSTKLKIVENNFLNYCDLLTSNTNKVKLGFDNINNILTSMTNQQDMVMLAIQLLAIDAEGKREGGLQWWDTCSWHGDIQ